MEGDHYPSPGNGRTLCQAEHLLKPDSQDRRDNFTPRALAKSNATEGFSVRIKSVMGCFYLNFKTFSMADPMIIRANACRSCVDYR